jgi:hypothetical protein
MNDDSLPIVKYVTNASRKYADLLSIAADLRSTDEICQRLVKCLEDPSADKVLIDALSTASLVRYARCFVTGKRATLDTQRIAHLPGDPIRVHEYYKDLRDKLAAHSVNPFEETLVGLALSDPLTEPRLVLGTATLSRRHIAHDKHGVEQLGRMACEFLKSLTTEIEQCQAEVLAEAQSHPIDDLYKLDPLQFTTPSPQQAGKGRR